MAIKEPFLGMKPTMDTFGDIDGDEDNAVDRSNDIDEDGQDIRTPPILRDHVPEHQDVRPQRLQPLQPLQHQQHQPQPQRVNGSDSQKFGHFNGPSFGVPIVGGNGVPNHSNHPNHPNHHHLGSPTSSSPTPPPMQRGMMDHDEYDEADRIPMEHRRPVDRPPKWTTPELNILPIPPNDEKGAKELAERVQFKMKEMMDTGEYFDDHRWLQILEMADNPTFSYQKSCWLMLRKIEKEKIREWFKKRQSRKAQEERMKRQRMQQEQQVGFWENVERFCEILEILGVFGLFGDFQMACGHVASAYLKLAS